MINNTVYTNILTLFDHLKLFSKKNCYFHQKAVERNRENSFARLFNIQQNSREHRETSTPDN